MANLKIKHKILLTFLLVSLVPVLVVIVILINNTQNQLRKNTYTRQSVAASQAAERVDNFLGSKINTLIFQSQTSAIRKFDIPDAELNLASLIKQDRDLKQVALVDKKGNERVVLNKDGLVSKHRNVAKDDTFKSTTFLAGKEYIGPVKYDSNHEPYVFIAVPMIRFNEQQDLTHLSTAEFGKYRSPSDITGVLIAEYSLNDLWQSVLSTKIGNQGYAYVIDDKGNLIAYPDPNFLKTHQDVSAVHQVSDFLHGKIDEHESVSETGVKVLSSAEAISRTNWAVIVEEPISSVYKDVSSFYRLAITLLIATTVVVLVLSFLMRRQILIPIRQLAAGAQRMGAGDLEYKLDTTSRDELGNLAQTFNKMGQNLMSLIGSLKQKNISLEIEHRKLNRIIQSVSDGIVALDFSDQIVSINPPAAKLIGKHAPKLIGQRLNEAFRWQQNDRSVHLELDKPGVFLYDNLILKNGELISYVSLSVAILERETSDIKAIITIHDLTQSRELDIMKVDFVAIAAHELRTPLTFMRGYLELMKSEDAKQLTTVGAERLRRALIGVDQLSNLINNLLNVSKVERGLMQVSLSQVNLSNLLTQLTNQQRATAQLKKLSLNYQPPDEPLIAAADASAISEVLNNLLSNAIKYTPEGGHINVSLKRDGDLALTQIQDDGPGIDVNAQKHLFQKFYRVEHSLTTGNRGTGLGLYISKAIVQQHHGKIGVNSEPGKGSTFYFTLPLYDEARHGKLKQHTNQLAGVHGWITKNTVN